MKDVALMRLAHSGVNPDTIRRLVVESGLPGAVTRLRNGQRTSEAVRSALEVDPELYVARLAESGVTLIADTDSAYPDWLRTLPDHPFWLFVRGKLPEVPGVAVVGSRRATRYGTDIARAVATRVSNAGWPVISGLAAGVDAAAHVGALAGSGSTVAVLGSGIDVWYPRRNQQLGLDILAGGGCVISEAPPGARPEAWRFPARNRIISGLSGVIVVCEAAVKSGALITARLATEHGRFVISVPGDLTRATSQGTNLLIRDGAYPLTELDSLVSEIELVMGPAPTPVQDSGTGTAGGLLGFVTEVGASVDQLAKVSGLAMPVLLAELGTLEMSGAVVISGGGVRLP